MHSIATTNIIEGECEVLASSTKPAVQPALYKACDWLDKNIELVGEVVLGGIFGLIGASLSDW